MATTITGIGQSKVICALDTYTHTALASAPYFVGIALSEVPPSGVSIQIQHNGSPVITSAAPSSTQGIVSLQANIVCAASDTLSVVVSSSSLIDSGLNVLKGILTIHQGVTQ